VSEWKRWSDHPPQLGLAPIFLHFIGWSGHCQISNAKEALTAQWVGIEYMAWAATGIYRQEYFDTTGIWI